MSKFYFQKDILDSDELKEKPKKQPNDNLSMPRIWENIGLYSMVMSGALAFATAVLFLFSIFNPFFLYKIVDFVLAVIVFFLLLIPFIHFNRLLELYQNSKSSTYFAKKLTKEFVNFSYLSAVLASFRLIPALFGIVFQLSMAYFGSDYFNIQTVTYFIVLFLFLILSLPEILYYMYCIRFFSNKIKD
jgi:hypothetical protein